MRPDTGLWTTGSKFSVAEHCTPLSYNVCVRGQQSKIIWHRCINFGTTFQGDIDCLMWRNRPVGWWRSRGKPKDCRISGGYDIGGPLRVLNVQHDATVTWHSMFSVRWLLCKLCGAPSRSVLLSNSITQSSPYRCHCLNTFNIGYSKQHKEYRRVL